MDSLLPGSLSVTSDLLVTLIYRLQGPGGTESEKGKQEFEVRRKPLSTVARGGQATMMHLRFRELSSSEWPTG